MGSMSIIEGNEILLRHLMKQDLEDFTFVVTNPLYGKFSPLGKITSEAASVALEEIIHHYRLNTYEFWVVLDKDENKIAGFVGHHPIVYENRLQEMFFAGFYTKYWGSKFPELATRYVCHNAFKEKNIPKLVSFVHPEDTASLMCAQIVDAKFEGETSFFGVTLFLFSLERKDFEKIAA